MSAMTGPYCTNGKERLMQRGFTLVELLITVAVVVILASIAIPNYVQYTKRAARAEAKAILLENAQFMERNFTEANRYDRDSAGTALAGTSLPASQSPRDGSAKYTMSLNATQTAFTLSAVPVVGGPMDGDECGSLTYNQLGQKGLAGASLSVADCWNK